MTDKLTRVHDTIWCCRSGSAADTQAIADIVHYQLGLYTMMNGPPTTQTAAAIFQEICYANKDQLRCVDCYLRVSVRWQVHQPRLVWGIGGISCKQMNINSLIWSTAS